MKTATIILAIIASAFAASYYTTKYDNVDIDAILANQRLTGNYVKCLLEQGPCSEDGKTLKQVIPDALITGCSKCNDKQKDSVRKVIHHLIKNRNSDWQALTAKYDPNGEFRKNYQKYLDEVSR